MQNNYGKNYSGTSATTECEIKGKRVIYDACSEDTLESAKAFYGKSFKYIGSSKKIFYNGNRSSNTKLHHFFIKTL